MVVLYTSLEDLIEENDRRCDSENEVMETTTAYVVVFAFSSTFESYHGATGKIASSMVTLHLRRYYLGCTINLMILTQMTAMIC
jgi:hypothetical protein